MTRGRLARFKLRKSPDDVLAVLRNVIRDASKYVPLYRDAFANAGVDPERFRRMEDLHHLPVIDKNALLSEGLDNLRAGSVPEELAGRSTTGSRGTPMTVYASPTEVFFRKATLLDAFRRVVNLPFPLRIADVGVEQGKIGMDIPQRLGLVRINRIFRALPAAEQARQLSQLDIAIVEGRPSSLFEVALEAQRLSLRLPRPKMVASFGEALYPHVRQLLEATFGCPVIDYYNCEEVGNVAWECPRSPGRMHVNSGTAFVEVVDERHHPTQPGEIGRILLTNLYNRTMPFIRYDIGDCAALLGESSCACGFEGTSMRLVEGRDEDFFLLPDGQFVSPRKAYEAIAGVLSARHLGNALFRAIERFQIIQESKDLVSVHVVPGVDYTAALWNGVENSARELHPAMRVQIREVPQLEMSPGGKIKQVMSRVDPSVVDGRRNSEGG